MTNIIPPDPKSSQERVTPTLNQTRPFIPSQLSFAKRKDAQIRQMQAAGTIVTAENKLLGTPSGPLSGDVTKQPKKTLAKLDMTKTKSRSMYFKKDLQTGREASLVTDHIQSEAIIIAEVRTNVIVRHLTIRISVDFGLRLTPRQIGDELGFITDLSSHLSIRYQRPVSSVVITLQHGACMLFGGTFDPAYIMYVFALPSDIAPTKNKRNAALIQKRIEESLGVVAARGFIRFVPILEENAAWNGTTVAGKISEAERKYEVGNTSSMAKRKLTVKASRLPSCSDRLLTPGSLYLRSKPRYPLQSLVTLVFIRQHHVRVQSNYSPLRR